MPHFSAPAALEIVLASQDDLPFIVVSGTIGEETAVAMMKAGAHDYLMKAKLTRLPETVRREVREASIRAERRQAAIALQESEAKNRAILAAIPDLMFRVGADGRYRELVAGNLALNAFFNGCDPIGTTIAELLPPQLAARKLYHLQAALKTGTLQVYEQPGPAGDRLLHEEIRIAKRNDDEALVMVRDISARKQAEANLAKRDRFLATLVDVQRLLLADSLQLTTYQCVLALIGAAAEADRAYLFENHCDAGGNLRASQRAEWCASGIAPQLDNPHFQNLCYDEVAPRWRKVLERGGIINARLADCPGTLRPLLEEQAVQSMLLIPTLANGEFLGFVGFDACRLAKRWEVLEIELLSSAAAAIALAKEREQATRALARLSSERHHPHPADRRR